ncbi:MAG: hypothetical protein GX829_01720 [Clostridium sp.]|jgi:membrane-associated protein|nr:hypothetical protein [Clostridium sp.]
MQLTEVFDVFMNMDVYIVELIDRFGVGAYFIIFMIIFLETGAVVLAALPGDSLLVGAGAFAGSGDLELWILLLGFFSATVLGDSLNFKIGQFLGQKYKARKKEKKPRFKFINEENFDKVQHFFTHKGRRAFLISRFVPIARTLMPFTAGFSGVSFFEISTFIFAGNAIWSTFYVMVGFFVGNLNFLKGRFGYLIFIIFAISMIPALVYYIRNQLLKQKNKND